MRLGRSVLMPRSARAIIPDVSLHVIQRGNNRAACFRADTDRLLYLALLADRSRTHGCDVHAYCLMTNHVHLLLTPHSPSSCARMMKDLSQCYAQYTNRTYERTGSLWEGRYRSCLTQSERYVLACYRYIEMNPVRAGMVSQPDEYPWSSYRANAQGRRNPHLTPHAEFLALGTTEDARQAAYRVLVADALAADLLADIRIATNGGLALGNSAFRSLASRAAGRRLYREKSGRPPQNGDRPRATHLKIRELAR